MSTHCEEDCDSAGVSKAERRSGLVLAIWALTIFTAFLFGSTVVNVVITRQAYEGTLSQIEAIRALNDSMLEVRKSIAEFSGFLQEAQEMEHGADNGGPFQRSFMGDEKV
jgi:hypothetical protein